MYVVYLLIAVFANLVIAVLSVRRGLDWTAAGFVCLALVAAVATIISGFLRLPP